MSRYGEPHNGAPITAGSRISALRFQRSADDRVLAGVAGGLGSRLGVDPVVVRMALVVLTVAAAAGLVLYAVAWRLSQEPTSGGQGAREPSAQQGLALGLVTLGVLLLLRRAGLWLGDTVAWPVVLGTAGSAIVWGRADKRPHPLSGRPGSLGSVVDGPVSVQRMLIGVALVGGGVALFLARTQRLEVIGDVMLAMAVTGAGALLLFGPAVWRLAQELAEERRERIRSQERAEVAAHLHDSVLQTLTLIQRSDDPRRMVSLARGQERRLRAWLYGAGPADGDRLGAAVESVVEDVEAHFGVSVEVVIVRDERLTDPTRALVQATREALTNAAKHAGASTVSLFVEAEAGGVGAFVRDRGVGFDPGEIADDRRGVRDSMIRRLERHGGTVVVESAPGRGTEVSLWVPRGSRARNDRGVHLTDGQQVT